MKVKQAVYTAIKTFTLVFTLSLVSSAQVTVVDTIRAEIDNSMYSEGPNNSAGMSDFLFAGRTLQNALRRALVRFDLSTVPADATIMDAEVQLVVSRVNPSGAVIRFSAHRASSEWGEGTSNPFGAGGQGAPAQVDDATWSHRLWPNTLWMVPGGDFEPASADAAIQNRGDILSFGGATITGDVESWYNGAEDNFGWFVIATDEMFPSTATRFFSTQHPEEMERPALILTYEVDMVDCAITDAGLANIMCDDNGTLQDDSDDVIRFELNPTAAGNSAMYNVDVPMGYNVSPSQGTYGVPTMFSLQAGSAGAGDVMISVVDDLDPSCMLDATLTDPGTCSDAMLVCDIVSSGLSDILCDDADTDTDTTDDMLRFTLEPTANNASTGYSVLVPPGYTVTPSGGRYGAQTLFELQSGSAGDGDVILLLVDSMVANCTLTDTLTDPGACSACDIGMGVLDGSGTDCEGDTANMISFLAAPAPGADARLIVYEQASGVIIGILDMPLVDFDNFDCSDGCGVVLLSFLGIVDGLGIGGNIAGLDGCFSLTEEIVINQVVVDGGTISTSDTTAFCLDDTSSHVVNMMTSGSNSYRYILVDESGTIVDDQESSFDFDEYPAGSYEIYGVSYGSDLMVGMTLGDVRSSDDCIQFSDNSIMVVSESGDCFVSANEIEGLGEVLIYPNPASSEILVEQYGTTSIDRVELFAIDGHMVRRLNGQHNTSIRIAVYDLVDGLYIVRYYTQSGLGHKVIAVSH